METTTTKSKVKTVFPERVRLDLSRHDAIQLWKLLKNGKVLSASTSLRIRQEFGNQLEAEYEYEVQCTDCSNKFKIISRHQYDDARSAAGGICVSCSDGYK